MRRSPPPLRVTSSLSAKLGAEAASSNYQPGVLEGSHENATPITEVHL